MKFENHVPPPKVQLLREDIEAPTGQKLIRARVSELKMRVEYLAKLIIDKTGLDEKCVTITPITRDDMPTQICQFGFKMQYHPAKDPYVDIISIHQVETMDEVTAIIWAKRAAKRLQDHIHAIGGSRIQE